MSYFTDATQGLNVATGFLKQTKRLFQNAGFAWIVLTDWGYEVQIFGELVSMSSSLDEAIEELETALLHSRTNGLPDGLAVIYLGDGLWGVDMVDLTRRARQALESL